MNAGAPTTAAQLRGATVRMVDTKINGHVPLFQSDETDHSAKAASAACPDGSLLYQLFDGSVVDYRGDNGYGELGFDSGEGA